MTSLLIEFIQNKDTSNALALIETGNSAPGQVDRQRRTALIYACQLQMPEVALALIETRDSNPTQVDTNRSTALIYACMLEMSDVALALIETRNSKPEQVNKYKFTALMYACMLNMPVVALALIATGQSNPGYVDRTGGRTALFYAQQEHETMQEVVELLLQVAPPVAAPPVAPPVAQRGVAFEIHNFFNLLDIDKITKFITQFNDSKPEFNNNVEFRQGRTVVTPFSLDPLLSSLCNFVYNTGHYEWGKINELTSINNSIESYGNYD
jgi:hypothetical protein